MNNVQQCFYLAECFQDINKSIFVHDFLHGYPIELIKVDRLKSKTTIAEDDKGMKVYNQFSALILSSNTLYLVHALSNS